MNEDVLQLAYEHAGYEYREVLEYFWGTEGFELYTEYEEGKLRAFLCYIPLPLTYDMICVTDKDNDFSLYIWRILSKLLKSRTKEIRINSTTRHPAIQKAIKKYGGYRNEDTLIFVKE